MKQGLRKFLKKGFATSILLASATAYGQHVPVINFGGETSTEKQTYNSAVPLFGKKLGSNIWLPQPHGFSANIYYGRQDLVVDNLTLRLVPFSEVDPGAVLAVESFTQDAQTVNFKFDTWVLPFLNVYGLAGVTNIDNDIQLDSKTDLAFNTKTSGGFFGFGGMLAGILGKVYVAAEANAVYQIDQTIDGADLTTTTSLRAGPVFSFKEKPNRNLIVWIGGQHTALERETSGVYDARVLFPGAEDDINRTIFNLDGWYNGLDDEQQAEYKDDYNTVRNGLEYLAVAVNTTDVEYEYEKELDVPFDLLIGAQYQFTERFQIQGEMEILGDRTAGRVSFVYRFGNKAE